MKNAFFNKVTDHQINVERANENIVPPKDMEKIISDVFGDLSRMIACTIGPAGGNTLVTEPYASTPIFPSKDGFRVMNNHIYDNPAYESIYRIVRDISGRMNETVGDATTSGVIIADAFYKSIKKYLKKHKEITPYGIGNLLKLTLKAVETILLEKGYIKNISDLPKDKRVEIYKKIATISANNDSEIGKKVADIYEKSTSDYAYIDIQQSTNENDDIEVNLGFEIPYGYTHTHMANSADGITAEYDDPLFLLIDGPILDPDLDTLKRYVRIVTEEMDNPRPLVIIAGEYSKKVVDFLTECRTGVIRTIRNQQVAIKLPVLSICFNMMNEMGLSKVQDLEAILGAKAIQTNNGRLQQAPENAIALLGMLGRADHITTKYAYTRIRGGGGSEAERKGRIAEIEKLYNSTKDDAQHGTLAKARLENLKRRMGMLQGEMHCIRVGGDSYKSKVNRSLIYEDAVQAVKACIDHGVTLGGQVAISAAIKSYKDDIIDLILDSAKNDKDNPINIIIGENKDLRKIVSDILDIVSKSSSAAFRAVFANASNNKKWINTVFNNISKCSDLEKSNSRIPGSPMFSTYNLILGDYERFTDDLSEHIPNLIVPGNTDIELLNSVFEIVNLFVTSNQLISLLPRANQK